MNEFPINGFYSCGCRTNDGWNNGETFNEHGLTSCVEKDECTEGPSPCHADATCTNLSPGYECTCNGDLVGDGKSECKPPVTLPPTAAPVHPLSPEAGCQSDSECTGLSNSYCDPTQVPPSCSCLNGYFRLGNNCFPEMECEDSRRNNCDANARCIEQVPGYACACNTGWMDAPGSSSPGTSCVDVDECSNGISQCDSVTEDCVNLQPPSGYVCVPKTVTPPPLPPPTTTNQPPPSNPPPSPQNPPPAPVVTPGVTPVPTPAPTPVPPTPSISPLPAWVQWGESIEGQDPANAPADIDFGTCSMSFYSM